MTVIHPIAERTPRAEDSNVINCQKRGWRFGLWLFPLKVFLPSNFSSPNLATWHIFCFRVWKYSFNQHLFGWSGTLKWSECNFVSKFLDYVLWHTTISRWTRTMLRCQTTTSLAFRDTKLFFETDPDDQELTTTTGSQSRCTWILENSMNDHVWSSKLVVDVMQSVHASFFLIFFLC